MALMFQKLMISNHLVIIYKLNRVSQQCFFQENLLDIKYY